MYAADSAGPFNDTAHHCNYNLISHSCSRSHAESLLPPAPLGTGLLPQLVQPLLLGVVEGSGLLYLAVGTGVVVSVGDQVAMLFFQFVYFLLQSHHLKLFLSFLLSLFFSFLL